MVLRFGQYPIKKGQSGRHSQKDQGHLFTFFSLVNIYFYKHFKCFSPQCAFHKSVVQGGFREPFFLMFNISPSYLPTFGDDLVEGLGIGCKNGDYPCPQLPEEDWAQKRKRGAGSIAKGGEAKTIQGHAAGSCL